MIGDYKAISFSHSVNGKENLTDWRCVRGPGGGGLKHRAI